MTKMSVQNMQNMFVVCATEILKSQKFSKHRISVIESTSDLWNRACEIEDFKNFLSNF